VGLNNNIPGGGAALGDTNTINGFNSYAIGRNQNVDGSNSFALGTVAATVEDNNTFAIFPGNDGSVVIGDTSAAGGHKLYVNGSIRSTSIDLSDGVNTGPLQVDCTTVGDGNCYAVVILP
jgi:hypothetical protein